MRIRLAIPADLKAIARFKHSLWPDGSETEHHTESEIFLATGTNGTLPLVLFVAEGADDIVGFLEIGLRSHAEGCDPAHAVAFVEGWYVDPKFRKQSIGRALMQAAEDWARAQGCVELASDAELENESAQHAHEALGFEEVERSVSFRKSLGR